MEPSETSSTSENQSKELADKKAFNEFVARARAMARKKKEASGSKAAVESVGSPGSLGSVESVEPAEEMVCCKGIVHIAYRGIADDRVYMSYSRLWNEIRFFRPNGLKVFCADCRSRVL